MFQNEEKEFNLREYLYVLRKWRWVIIAVFVVVVFAVTLRTFRQAPIYRATARIMIEKETSNIPFIDTVAWVTWDKDYLESQYEILKSRSVAKQVVQKLNMMEGLTREQPNPKSSSIRTLLAKISEMLGVHEPPLSPAVQSAAKEEQRIRGFLSMITVTPIGESRLVDISATTTDRELAELAANTLVETYIEQNLETRVTASRDSVRWLIQELEFTRKKLTDSKAALQEYKEQQAVISFEDRQNIVLQKLSDLNAAVNNTKIKRMTIEAQYNKIQQYGTTLLATLPQVINNPLIQKLKSDLSALETELSELEKKFRSKHPNIIAVQSQITSVQGKLDSEMKRIVESTIREYEMAQAQERVLTKALEAQKREAQALNQKTMTSEVLQQEVESNNRVYEALLKKMKETSAAERLKISNIRIVDRATIPLAAIAPRKTRSIMLAIMAGLVLGTSLAFLLEYLDNTIRTPEDMKQYLDTPFLGIIPKMTTHAIVPYQTHHPVEKIVALAPRSPESETYRILRTNVTFSMAYDNYLLLERGPVLLITSASPEEGKSCTVANLGIALAQSGKKTLIIECDFRKPVMHRIFNMPEIENGFASVIANAETDRTKSWIRSTEIPNLSVVPCGKIPSNPSELLGSAATETIIKTLGKKFDHILIDSPPVNTVTDSILLSRLARGVMVVICAGKTKRDTIQHAMDQLRDADAMILGGVLNNVDLQKNRYYYYKYQYSYLTKQTESEEVPFIARPAERREKEIETRHREGDKERVEQDLFPSRKFTRQEVSAEEDWFKAFHSDFSSTSEKAATGEDAFQKVEAESSTHSASKTSPTEYIPEDS